MEGDKYDKHILRFVHSNLDTVNNCYIQSMIPVPHMRILGMVLQNANPDKK